tara:strand:- start:106 stop:789 length:684 start_codon:yes stop_codon:yes gene_type:complete
MNKKVNYMRDIDLKNQEFLGILNEYKDVLLKRDSPDDIPLIEKEIPIRHTDDKAEDWVSDQYLKEIISQGEGHDGFPRVLRGFSGLKHEDEKDVKGRVIKDASSVLNRKLIEFLSCRNSALNACYPPGGFISWHNNANASGYNIIITYSETGEGWFDYWDIEKQERVRIQDKPGWQAKMTYFGPYDEPDQLCYHAAYTDCYRITVAFVFAEADQFWEEVIEDLETEC